MDWVLVRYGIWSVYLATITLLLSPYLYLYLVNNNAALEAIPRTSDGIEMANPFPSYLLIVHAFPRASLAISCLLLLITRIILLKRNVMLSY